MIDALFMQSILDVAFTNAESTMIAFAAMLCVIFVLVKD